MLFNEVLSSRFNRLLQAFLPIDEQHGSPVVSPELGVGFTLETERPEWEFLKGEVLRSCGVRAGPDAANQSGIFLMNPVGSRALLIVDRIDASTLTANGIQVQDGAATVFTPVTAWRRDTRWAVQQGIGAVHITTGAIATATGTGVIAQLATPAGTPVSALALPYVLGPGRYIVVNSISNNITLDATIYWRERVAQPAELP